MAVTTGPSGAALGALLRDDMLASLYQHRLLSTSQLWGLHRPTTSRRSTQSVLAQLEREGYVARVSAPSRSHEALWFVTEQGAEATEGGGVVCRRYRMTAERARGPLQAHTLAVNDVGIAFVEAARVRGDDFDFWGWRHEVAHRVGERDGKGAETVIADAVIDYTAHAEGALLCRFVELDRATMPLRELEAKLTGYARLYRYRPKAAGGWSADLPQGWRQLYPLFPKVLVVLCGRPAHVLASRMRALLELVWANPNLRDLQNGETDFDIFLTTLEQLRAHGPFSPVFRRPAAPETPVDVLGRPSKRPKAS
jgi:hypothetical protein